MRRVRALLRSHRQGPCSRRAAKERDELAPSKLIELHPSAPARITG